MEQKLQNLLYSLPTRTAWIIIGSCAAFWLICLTGVLTPPVSAPPNLTLFWFYAMLMLILASGLAVIGAAAVLLAKRGRRSGSTGQAPAALDQFAGLGSMLDGPPLHVPGSSGHSSREPGPSPRGPGRAPADSANAAKDDSFPGYCTGSIRLLLLRIPSAQPGSKALTAGFPAGSLDN